MTWEEYLIRGPLLDKATRAGKVEDDRAADVPLPIRKLRPGESKL
jgi:hypothetical protein